MEKESEYGVRRCMPAGIRKKGKTHMGPKIFINVVKISAFTTSMMTEPTPGTTKKAVGEGPYFFVNACILETPLGIAPSPKPQNPVTITAAS